MRPVICIIYEFGVAILLLDYCPGNNVPGSNLVLHLFFLVPLVIALLLQITTRGIVKEIRIKK